MNFIRVKRKVSGSLDHQERSLKVITLRKLGLWVDNQLEGEGQEIRVDGTKYFGHFRNGKKDGRCLVYFRDGTK